MERSIIPSEPIRSWLPSAPSTPLSDQAVAEPNLDAAASHHLDTRFYVPEDKAEYSQHSSDVKHDLQDQLATCQNFEDLNGNFKSDRGGANSWFAVIDMTVLKDSFSVFKDLVREVRELHNYDCEVDQVGQAVWIDHVNKTDM